MYIALNLNPMFWLMVALCGACGAMIVIVPMWRRMRALEGVINILCKRIARLSQSK